MEKKDILEKVSVSWKMNFVVVILNENFLYDSWIALMFFTIPNPQTTSFSHVSQSPVSTSLVQQPPQSVLEYIDTKVTRQSIPWTPGYTS